jgi:hypothetical protein
MGAKGAEGANGTEAQCYGPFGPFVHFGPFPQGMRFHSTQLPSIFPRAMPRGKRTVFAGFCKECKRRVCTIRLHKQKENKTWKDFGPSGESDKGEYLKFCKGCKKRTSVKLKEEKHTNK